MQLIVNSDRRSRNQLIDVAKGIAILLVLIGHSIQYASGASYAASGAFYNNCLFKVIYTFHMPLFMVISGYLFRFSIERKTAKNIVVDRLKTLLLPIFAFALVVFCVKFNPELGFFDQIRRYFSFTRYTLWFLWALFYASIGVLLINKLFKDNVIVYLLVFLSSLCLPDKYFFELYKFMFPCFVFGYFVEKKGWITLMRKHLNPIMIFSLIIFVLMLFFYNTDCYVYMTGSYLFGTANPIRQLGIDLYRIAIGIAGSIFVMSLLMWIYAEKRDDCVTKSLCFFGSNTMGIYCIQNYFWMLYPLVISGVIYPILLNRAVAFVICLTVSCLVTMLMRKIRVLNFLFLGGR